MFPEPFLRYVNERHIAYSVEVRQLSGSWTCMQSCFPVAYHHPEEDLALLQFIDENNVMVYVYCVK
jgi:hypothetical protein